MQHQGKTAIPLVARIGLNPRRALTLPMLLVIVSRVTKGSDLGITPIHDGDDLSHLLKLEWSEDLYLFLNSFHPMTGKISLDLMNAAKINYVNQRAQGTTRINTASRTQRESSLLSPSHTPALSRRRRREIEEEDFKEMETTNNNTITPQRLQIQRTTNSTRTRQRQVTTLMPLQNVPELSRRRPRNYDDEDISSAATTRNPRSRRSHRGINELRPNNLINERHITLNEHSTVEGHTDERVHLNNATGYENNIGNLLLPIQKEHLSTEEYVMRTLQTLTIDQIDELTASWIVVY